MADAGLRRDAVGLREVLFQSITDMGTWRGVSAGRDGCAPVTS